MTGFTLGAQDQSLREVTGSGDGQGGSDSEGTCFVTSQSLWASSSFGTTGIYIYIYKIHDIYNI